MPKYLAIFSKTDKWELHFTKSQGAKTPEVRDTSISHGIHEINICNRKIRKDSDKN